MHAICVVIASAAALMGTTIPSAARATSDLESLVRAQTEEIRTLRARLDALEARDQGAVPPAPVAAPSPALAPVLASRAPDREPAPAARDLEIDWTAGAPRLQSADGRFSFRPRGRILMDVNMTSGSRYPDRNITTTGARALRMGIEGSAGKNIYYQFEADFATNAVDLVGAFLSWRSGIAGTGLEYDVRVGHLFNDRSFDGGTRSDMTSFLDRNTVAASIIPQRAFYGLGIQPRLFGPDWHASVTVTGDRADGSQSADDSRTILLRGHWNPIKQDHMLVHLGAWGFHEKLSRAAGTATRNAAIGGRFNEALRISTGPVLGATDGIGYGLELGGYAGPLWVMGEWGQRRVHLMDAADFETSAWSVSAGYFLSGEHLPYLARTGNLTSLKVLHPVVEGGSGAIELTARYESLAFRNIPQSSRGNAATLGVNWYLTRLVRLMFNAIHWETDNIASPFPGHDNGDTITARVSVSF